MSEEKPFRHIMPLQIRFNDVDKFGHVNNTVYFQFYDTAKTDYFATVCKGVRWDSVAIVVVHIEADFVAQVKADTRIAARTRVSRIGHKSFQLEQDVIDLDSQKVMCRCTSVMVLYDLQHQQAISLPEQWVESICEFDGLTRNGKVGGRQSLRTQG